MNLGGQGRSGERGGTWGAAQGPAGEAQWEGTGIRLLLADGNPALPLKPPEPLGLPGTSAGSPTLGR